MIRRPARRALRMTTLLTLVAALAGCAGARTISPNDPEYARNGAPRAGQPVLPSGSGYVPLGGAGGMM
jgi:hypothetical protein